MSTVPVVTRMVMFKHGVAYLERSGPAEGAFELSFKRDEMNDVLKSLAVWVARGDATVGAIAFEKPEDPEKALDERKLNFPVHQTLVGLLGAARGRRVALLTADARYEGEMLGFEARAGAEQRCERVALVRSPERVLVVDLNEIRSFELLDETSRADLAFVVDRRRAATSGENRTVSVALSGRADDLRVSYVVPAPTWRVSYRFARDGETTLIMAWGIIHNPADEDLHDIDLTLTTGQPISFTIDLYNPKNVKRVVVEETSRALASAPTSYERAPIMRSAAPAPAAPASFGPPGGFGAAPAMAPQAQRLSDTLGASFQDNAASFEDRGELFEYRVAQKVSLRRGGSAMVPLLGCAIRADKERIWRAGGEVSPDLVLSFKNETGAVLEEGPAVIYDESVYAGEAMVPYSARGVLVKLAFAKDLGVRCKRASTQRTVVTRVTLTQASLAEEQRHEEHIELRAESDHAEVVDVIFELPKVHGRTLDDAAAAPFEETMSYRRFKVSVPPRGKAELVVVERWHDYRYTGYQNMATQQLESWLESRFLDKTTFGALSEVLAAWQEARALDEQQARVDREQKEAYAKQTKVAEQLKVLKEGGAEGALRLRYVAELEAEQNKVNGCESDMRRLRDAAEAARRRGAEKLAGLTAPPQVPSPAGGK